MKLNMKKYLMANKQIRLRNVSEKDAEIIVRWKNDPFVRKMALNFDTKITCRNQKQNIQQALKSKWQIYLIIELCKTGKSIGYIRIDWMDKGKRFAWLRFVLGEERGKGYAKQALRLFLKKLFTHGCHRIEAETYEFNKASQAVLESIGFKKEGIKRQAHFDGKKYYDVVVYGLIKNEFENILTR